MKDKIHPKYNQVEVKCDCGNSFKVGSTKNEPIHVEVCSACHPLYTGKKKLVDTTGRVKRFQDMMAKSKDIKKDQPKKKTRKPSNKKKER